MKRKSNLVRELNEGFTALVDRRVGKRTLRTHTVKVKAPRGTMEFKILEIL